MSCKEKRQKITGEEIRKELEGYEMVKDVLTLRIHDRVKYIRKKDGRFIRGGIVVLGDYKKDYIVIQGFGRDKKTCKPIRYSITLSEVILFRKKE
jgi:hypothetical protein